MLPTVAQVLDMPVVQAGRPRVFVGADSLNREIRWVQVSELEDIGSLLQGGKLILTTGIVLPESESALRRYVDMLAAAGASGLLIELGRRFGDVPPAVVRACRRHGVPLIALTREVQFVRITEAIHALILQEQFGSLRSSERAHEVFTALCVKGASVAEIVREAARMAGAPVIFEDLLHRVMAYEAVGVPVEDLLQGWESRSRAAVASDRTAVCGLEGWGVTSVEAHGEVFGRLILTSRLDVTSGQSMLLERAATALTLNRLLERNRRHHRAAVHIGAGNACPDRRARRSDRQAGVGRPGRAGCADSGSLARRIAPRHHRSRLGRRRYSRSGGSGAGRYARRHVGGTWSDVVPRGDHLASFELDGAAGVADVHHSAGRLDEIAGIDRSQELDL